MANKCKNIISVVCIIINTVPLCFDNSQHKQLFSVCKSDLRKNTYNFGTYMK